MSDAPPVDVLERFTLSDERLALAKQSDRNALVLAGPGAGKTHLLVAHACWLAHRHDGRVVLLTYTRKAAAEMKRRADDALDAAEAKLIVARTIHAHAFELLRTYGHHIGLPSELDMFDGAKDLQTFADEVARHRGIQPMSDFAERFTKFQRLAGDISASNIPPLVTAVDEEMRSIGRLDWDSCVRLATKLLHEHRAVRETVLHHDRSVLLDEAQDCDAGQLKFLEQLVGAPPGERHFFVVMDPDQSLYGFRQANPDLVREWAERYVEQPVEITENRRCAPVIQALAKRILDREWAGPATDGRVSTRRFSDRDEEARWMAEAVAAEAARRPASRIAVLARRRSRLATVEAALAAKVQIRSDPVESWTMPENQILATIAFAKDWRDGVFSSEVILTFLVDVAGIASEDARAIEEDALRRDEHPAEKLAFPLWREFAQWLEDARRSPVQIVEYLGARLGRKKDQLAPLLNLAGRARNLADVLRLARNGPEARPPQTDPGVLVTTFHGAKGLEFDTVFIVGCEDGTIPDFRAAGEKGLRDERRALYVAVTRAAREVILTTVARDHGRDQRVSPFLPAPDWPLWSAA